MLYFVSTPIGNLSDISLRALDILKTVDFIACEDTRHSLKLLNYYSIKKPLFAYHKFNEITETDHIVNELKKGKNIAVISDAGTPLISDPGNILTKRLVEENLEYTIIPGATAFVPALILSGFNISRFSFIGFLPTKNKDRIELINKYKTNEDCLIFYSGPHDINNDLLFLYKQLGNRKVVAVKEITKVHEQCYRFDLEEANIDDPKGEFVIILEPIKIKKEDNILSEKDLIELYIKNGVDKKEALKKVAKERGIAKSELYKYTIDK